MSTTDTPAPVGRVTIDHDRAVAIVTLDRPATANAFNTTMYREMRLALLAAADNPEIGAVLVTSVGKHFCAGQDLDEMSLIATGQATREAETAFPALLDVLQSYPLPLIAAVRGAAVGLGMTMLGHFDLVVVADDARLRVPFAPLGVPPEAGSSATLPAAMGRQRAAEALFTGRFISGAEAAAAGLALRAVSSAEVEATARGLADEVATHPVAALRAIKAALVAARIESVRAARAHEEEAFARLFRQEPAGSV